MMIVNPIKAFNTFMLDEQTEQAVATFLRNVDLSYRGRATVSETIAPCQRGRVYFQGSWWPALCEQEITLAVGEVVQVIGRQNITLLVRLTHSVPGRVIN